MKVDKVAHQRSGKSPPYSKQCERPASVEWVIQVWFADLSACNPYVSFRARSLPRSPGTLSSLTVRDQHKFH